jgi:CRISPR-associated protein Csx16
MTTFLITRHPGTLDWITRQGLVIDHTLEHLEPGDLEVLQSSDIVIGSLPIHLAAQVCARGAHFVNLSFELPRELRGQELDAATLERLAVRLEAYHVQHLSLPALQPLISRGDG